MIETGLVLTHSFDYHFSLDGQIVWYQIDNLSNLCLSYNQTYHALTHDLMCHFSVDNRSALYQNDGFVNHFSVDIQNGLDIFMPCSPLHS